MREAHVALERYRIEASAHRNDEGKERGHEEPVEGDVIEDLERHCGLYSPRSHARERTQARRSRGRPAVAARSRTAHVPA